MLEIAPTGWKCIVSTHVADEQKAGGPDVAHMSKPAAISVGYRNDQSESGTRRKVSSCYLGKLYHMWISCVDPCQPALNFACFLTVAGLTWPHTGRKQIKLFRKYIVT